MRIAICEDERSDQELLEGYCKQFNPEDSVFSFQDGESLLSAFREDCFDLVFLDIELGGLNGLDVGKALIELRPRPVIVFTTQSLHYAVRGYGIALRYLTKPISYEMFDSVMRLAREKLRPRALAISVAGTQRFIPITEILYIESLRHQLVVHLLSGERLLTRGNLSEIISRIPDGSFSQPHKSYCVNMEYVDSLAPQGIILTNGDMIPIGRTRKELFHAQLFDYMKGSHSNEYMD